MKRSIAIIALLLPLLVHSQDNWRVSQETASQVGTNAFKEALWNSGYEAQESLNILSIYQAQNLYHLRFSQPEGFIIISSDRRTWPILAWGFGESPQASTGYPPAYQWLLDHYKSEIVSLNGTPATAVEAEWDRLTNNNPKPISLASVMPMVHASWGQGCNFNALCPVDSAASGYWCYHVPAGCVSTAMSQIMKYWEHPAQGTGSHSYSHAQYGTLAANFATSTYDWSLMPGSVSNVNSEISELMYHLGVGVNMIYGPSSSGSYAADARNAIVNYFKYDPGAVYRQKISYTDQAWHTLLKTELDAGRPVFYGGLDPNGYGGHAWVVDGYQGSYYHINWGWDGALNGYFLLTALNPQGNANFTNLHEAIMGIKPLSAALHAQFLNDKNQLNPGDTVVFTDVSTGNPTSWLWNFPGGTPSSANTKNPGPIVYNNTGVYDVKLIVGNGITYDTLLLEDVIKVLPNAMFKSSTQKTEVGGMVDFFDLSESIGPISSWQWQFPGAQPASSSLKNPIGIKYTASGIYDVSLTINTSSGQNTLTMSGFIKVYSQCDTMMDCDVDLPCYVQPLNASAFQTGNFDLDNRTPYYAGLGHTTNWIRFHDVIGPGDTNFFWGATSWFVPAGQADNWLIFGPITIPAGGASMQWSHLYWLNNKRDGYEVVVTKGAGVPTSSYDLPLAAFLDNDPSTEGDTVWTTFEAGLSPSQYGGQTVHIAFHHNADDMSYLFLDDFRVISCSGLPNAIVLTSASESLGLYPNPASEAVIVSFPRQDMSSSLSVLDLSGRVLHECDIPAGEIRFEMDIKDLCSGIYLISLQNSQSRVNAKLIVK